MADSEETQLQLEELRLRLDRRNNLLDIIRKAYHRDVLVVREYLLQLKAGVSVESIISDNTELRSIPSIDLREEGLHLYAPEECELRLQPCFHCGGRLEIVHRESSRISSLTKTCDDLNNEMKNLKTKLSNTALQLEDEKGIVRNLQQKFEINRKALEDKDKKLQKRDVEYEILRKKCMNLQNENDKMNTIRNETEETVKILATVENDLTVTRKEKENLLATVKVSKESILSLDKEKSLVVERKNQLEQEVTAFRAENDALVIRINEMEEMLQHLQKKANYAGVEIPRLNDLLTASRTTEANIQELLTQVTNEKEQLISKLEEYRLTSERTIIEVRANLNKKTKESNDFEVQLNESVLNYKNAMKDIKSEQLLFKKCRERLESSCNSVDNLSTLTSSYIRGLFDHCLAQENILRLGESLPSNRTSTITHIPETNLSLVMDRLGKKLDSSHVNWGSVLADEKDRRQIYGNLNNRMHMNLNEIDKLIKTINKKHEAQMKRRGEANVKRELVFRRLYEVKESEAEEQKKKQMEEFHALSKEFNDTRIELDKTVIELRESIKENEKDTDIIKKLANTIIQSAGG